MELTREDILVLADSSPFSVEALTDAATMLKPTGTPYQALKGCLDVAWSLGLDVADVARKVTAPELACATLGSAAGVENLQRTYALPKMDPYIEAMRIEVATALRDQIMDLRARAGLVGSSKTGSGELASLSHAMAILASTIDTIL